MHKIIQFILGIFLLSFAQDTCAQTPYSSQNFNLNNFFNYFPRNAEFTSVYNKADLITNEVANQYPQISTYSRGNF